MKKITYLFLLLPFVVLSQIDLLQTTDNTVVASTSIACGNTSLGYTAENNYARLYNLAALGYSSFEVTKVSFGVESFSLGSALLYPVDVDIYSSTGGVTLSNLTYEGGDTVLITPAMVGQVVEVSLTTPITVTTPEMVVVVYAPDGSETATTFYIGANSNGQTGSSYILANDCGISSLVTYTSINFPNVNLVLFPSGNPTLSANDFDTAKSISVYPNPVKDVLNISIPQGETIKEIIVYSVLGKEVIHSRESLLDVKSLESGVYFVQITTDSRSITEKIVKN